MRKFIFCVTLLSCAIKLWAQAEPNSYHTAVDKFKIFYNNNQPDSVFEMFSPDMKNALPLDVFKNTTAQLKSQLGNLNETKFVRYDQPLGIYKATFQNDAFLLNIALNAKNEFTGLRLTPNTSNISSNNTVDPSLVESPITVKTLTGTISGTLTTPKDASGKIPVVIIIPGTGPIDRDGNSNTGLTTNMYKLLAYALGKSGIASVRYDRRMVGQSTGKQKEKDLRFEDNVDDVVSLIDLLTTDERFSKIILAGHSEGALVGMLATHDEPVKAFISIEGAGYAGEKILMDQMKNQPQYMADGIKNILDSLKRGKINPNVDPQLYSIARPGIQYYLMSWCRYDPTQEIRKLKMPILLIQGTADLQVPADNGQRLKSAKSSAFLMPVRGMNYVLKTATADKEQNIATYKQPDLSLNTELIPDIVDFIEKLK
jgi:pimeloyl-ACP methyl ester carboxylesterase